MPLVVLSIVKRIIPYKQKIGGSSKRADQANRPTELIERMAGTLGRVVQSTLIRSIQFRARPHRPG